MQIKISSYGKSNQIRFIDNINEYGRCPYCPAGGTFTNPIEIGMPIDRIKAKDMLVAGLKGCEVLIVHDSVVTNYFYQEELMDYLKDSVGASIVFSGEYAKEGANLAGCKVVRWYFKPSNPAILCDLFHAGIKKLLELPGTEYTKDQILAAFPPLGGSSSLKHKIGHMFLAIDVDLQGIEAVVLEPSRKIEALNYFKKAFVEPKNSLTVKIEAAKKEVAARLKSEDIEGVEKTALEKCAVLLGQGDVRAMAISIDKAIEAKGSQEPEFDAVVAEYLKKDASEEKRNRFHNWFVAVMGVFDGWHSSKPK